MRIGISLLLPGRQAISENPNLFAINRYPALRERVAHCNGSVATACRVSAFAGACSSMVRAGRS